jgi:hypothetical protein
MALQEHLDKLIPVKKGDSTRKVASSERVNAIQEAIKAMARGDHIRTGKNLRRKTGSGFVMLTADDQGGGGGGEGDFPWQISVEEDPPAGSGVWSVHVKPGTINNILPSNIFDSFEISETGTFYVVLDVTTDGDSPTDASLDAVSSPPEGIGSSMGVAPDSFSILLGVVVDKVPFQLINTLINVQPQLTILSLSATPTPGQPFFDLNYTWQINLG